MRRERIARNEQVHAKGMVGFGRIRPRTCKHQAFIVVIEPDTTATRLASVYIPLTKLLQLASNSRSELP